ncbi:N-acetylglucosamine kinase [Actinoplanes ianthinogenes]|uniref:N-acetylglucosamine kinase n=1 Tax=Actinoplanes ianthinogenes TaxID=122358 RepID=A0ABM7MA48_9ACTN|nr:BadF/BadG/BcrA/BcrD ATPase family protein [Actinoplanes ianthinogenes]BCJ48484.1 N-acetylglucosamine kinase [Actinoplanes ianthinogenes]GGR46020.1 N-acetylglucosamine kinase [Actinoplanes ianthinogenes]
MKLVVGVDAGGTASTAVVATTGGRIVGRGRSGPGNPLTAGAGNAAAAVAAAVREALGEHSPALVGAATLGIAGPATATQFAPALAALGVTGPVTVVGDVVTAFAAGSPAEAGAVLIAGTGAIAAAVRADAVVRTADGLGWLLGDEGSGRWLGLQAVRVAVRDWTSPLAGQIAARAGVATADDMVYWAQALPWEQIGALAPLVCAAARAGDPHAAAIVDEAVTHLVRTLDELGAAGPVVLGGGLLACDTPVRDGVVATLRSRGEHPSTSRDPAAGAAWLAARSLSPLPPAALHERLLRRPPAKKVV